MLPLLVAAANLAPVLVKFLGAGTATEEVATKVAEIATTVAGTSSPEEAMQAILTDAAKANEFRIAINKQYMDLEEMFIKDIQDARDRDVKLAQTGFRNYRANWLTGFAIALVMFLLFVIIWVTIKDEWIKGVLLVALGRAWGYMDQIYGFEFGTTKQSKAKDDTIDALSKRG